MKHRKEFTITPGMKFEQIAALEKAAHDFFGQVSALGDADMFTSGASLVVRHDVALPGVVGEYGEITKDQVETGNFDTKGRSIGFVAVYRDNGEDFRCYVQSTRDAVEFGVPQRSKSFKSAAAARAYGSSTIAQRVARLVR
ncbi:MAG: hypothetical protein ACRC8D_07180 [Aeromonas sp.]